MNRVIISGNLYKDYNELSTSSTGNPYVNFTLCVSRGKGANGNDLPPAYVMCTAYGETARKFASCSRKGQGYVVEGNLDVIIKDNKQDGIKVTVFAIFPILNTNGYGAKNTPTFVNNDASQPSINVPPADYSGAVVDDSDLPF